jgi:hypothetical protein
MQNLIYTTPNSNNLSSLGIKNTKSTQYILGKKSNVKLSDYRSLNYILATPNNLNVKIVHTEHPSEGDPKIDVNIESSSLDLNLDKRQYQQLIGATVVFGFLERQKQLALLRPHRRPTRDPIGWWHYAYKLVTGQTVSTASKMDIMTRCMKVKKRYIALVKRSRASSESTGTSGSSTNAPGAGTVTFSARDESELRRIEESTPVQALLGTYQKH